MAWAFDQEQDTFRRRTLYLGAAEGAFSPPQEAMHRLHVYVQLKQSSKTRPKKSPDMVRVSFR